MITMKKKVASQASVSVKTPIHAEEWTETPHLKKVTVAKMSKVQVALGYTKNLGNYESLRVDVSLEMPCALGSEDAAFSTAFDWVDGKVNEVLEGLGE